MAAKPPHVPHEEATSDLIDKEQGELHRERVEGVFLSPTSLLSPSSLTSSAEIVFASSEGHSTPLALRAPWATPPVASLDSQIISSPPLSVNAATGVTSPPSRNATSFRPPPLPSKTIEAPSPDSDFDLHDLGSAESSTPTPRGAELFPKKSANGRAFSGRGERDRERSVHIEETISILKPPFQENKEAFLPFWSLPP